MEISLKPSTEAYLKAQVASGRFASTGDAIEALARGDEIMQADLDAVDLDWAKPYIDNGLADLDAGRVITSEAVHDELRRRFRAAE